MKSISIENSVFTKRPDLIMYFADPEDSKKYMPSSTEKVNLICPDCNCIKESTVINLATNGFTCPRCGDGISYPNKIMFSVLYQLNIPFINEFKPKWAMGRRYDFYFKLNGQEYVVEMDGGFHFNDNLMSGQTREESNRIDEEKNLYAAQNHVEMIRVVSRESEIEYLKEKILNSEINCLFNMSNIDWQKCGEYATKSLIKIACNLHNEGHSVKQIAEIMHMKHKTIKDYLDKGFKIGLCNYRPTNSRPVICLNTKIVYARALEAGRKHNIFIATITANCKGKGKSAGKDPITNEPYVWMFYDEYLKLDDKNINIGELTTRSKINKSGVICMTTFEVFRFTNDAVKKYGKIYGLSYDNITANAKGRTTFAGKLSDGTPLKWMYYDEYLKLNISNENIKDEYVNLNSNINDKSFEHLTCYDNQIVCLTTNEFFNTVEQAGDKYSIEYQNIMNVAQGELEFSGKLPDGTKLRWMWYDKYFEQRMSQFKT